MVQLPAVLDSAILIVGAGESRSAVAPAQFCTSAGGAEDLIREVSWIS